MTGGNGILEGLDSKVGFGILLLNWDASRIGGEVGLLTENTALVIRLHLINGEPH